MKKRPYTPPAPCHPERLTFCVDLCRECYRDRVQGPPEQGRGRRGRSLDEKMTEQVNRSPEWGGCHLWTGGFGQYGTPKTHHDGEARSMRRLCWENLHGPLPEGRQVTTTCNQCACLNPDHLALRVVGGSMLERFYEKVQRSGPTVRDDLGPCWTWLGGHQKGYGVFHPQEKDKVFAHRMVYELEIAPIPKDDGEWCVCHRCDNPGCINPAHLFLGRDRDNHDDMVRKGRAGWQKAKTSVSDHPIGDGKESP